MLRELLYTRARGRGNMADGNKEALAKRGGLFVATSQLVAAVEAIIETYNPPPVVRLGSLGNMTR